MLEQLLIFSVGIAIGAVVSGLVRLLKRRIAGTITVDRSLPEDPPRLFLELEDRSVVFDAADRKTVSFRVKHSDYMPRKDQPL